MPRALALTVLLALPAPAALAAQSSDHDFRVLEVPSSTAAMSMGDAFDLSGEDSDGIFYNPAAVGRAEGLVLGLQRFRDAGGQATLSAAAEWWDGRVGLGVQAMEWGAGERAGAGGLLPLLEDGAVGVSEWAASAGYAREVFGPTVGVVAKLLGRRQGAERDVAGAVDVGVTHGLGPVRLGLAARNLAGELLAGDAGERVPWELTLGAAGSGFEVGPLDLGGAARVTRQADDEYEAGAGLEVAYWPVVGRTFIGRVGLQTDPSGPDDVALTLGAAFHGDALVLEYAYRPVDLLGSEEGLHRITVGWR